MDDEKPWQKLLDGGADPDVDTLRGLIRKGRWQSSSSPVLCVPALRTKVFASC